MTDAAEAESPDHTTPEEALAEGEEASEPPEPTIPDVPSPELDRPTSPGVSVPELRSLADDVDPAFRAGFWKLVLAYDLALLAVSLGALLVYFDGKLVSGGQLLAGGGILLAYALYLTRAWQRKLASAEFSVRTDGEDDGGTKHDDGERISDKKESEDR